MCSKKSLVETSSALAQDTCKISHRFNLKDGNHEINSIRENLLKWYRANKRTLPWRTIASKGDEIDDDIRGYSVWVSEIMLQQTQVSTVIEYYNRWMKKWPTLKHLSEATLEDVHKVWSGLGYYSRGQRLLEGAKKIQQLGGHLPTNAKQIQDTLPGVGRYTAAAIASIAYNEKVGLVDGNVVRVLARLRLIGAQIESKVVNEAFWHNANLLVDDDNPGDFNQALMELGATICTPKNPLCTNCPISTNCLAFQQTKQHQDDRKNKFLSIKSEPSMKDIEDCVSNCELCLPKTEKYMIENGVTNYPRKGKKAAQRVETSLVYILKCKSSNKYCLAQRPDTGLLANLLEFPSVALPNWSEDSTMTITSVLKNLNEHYNLKATTKQVQQLGKVLHIFSHIKQTYLVYKVEVAEENYENICYEKNKYQKIEWITDKELKTSAISTAMLKVLKLDTDNHSKKSGHASQQVKRDSDGVIKSQRGIKNFFEVKQKS